MSSQVAPPSKPVSAPVSAPAGTLPGRAVELAIRVGSWAVALLTLFFVLKVVAIGWFFQHGVDPFSDYQRWKVPLLVATDLSAAAALSVVLGVLSSGNFVSRWPRLLLAVPLWLVAISTVAIAAVNLRIIEAYRAALDRYLLRKVGDPTVMSESIFANMDLTFISALGFGILVVVWLPGFLRKRAGTWTPKQAYTFFGVLLLLGTVPLVVAHKGLSGRETFGLKHNAVLALAIPPPDVFQYAEPSEAYARLKKELPGGPELAALAQTPVAAEPVKGHPELRGQAKGYNVVMLLLESVAAGYVNTATMPSLAALQQRSLRYPNHRTNAVNTFDAHYSLFRSMAVRGDSFVMRQLHQGFSRDVSIMEVLKGAGYSVGLFHASFLNFIDTRWVWEAPGVDKLVDAQQVMSASRPGWSWGANDADVADVALEWAKSQGQKPFFLVFNPAGSHHPYLAPRETAPFPGDECEPRYKSALYAVDKSVGRLLDGLKHSGLAERTIVIAVSDHGELIDVKGNVCGHGMQLVEDELKVPFLIYHPKLMQGPSTDALETSHWDFAPTVASLLDVPAPASWLGRDLLADEVKRRATFVELNYRKHTAVIVDGAIGDLDVSNSRMSWTGKPPADAKRFESLLRTFDDRVVFQHAQHVLDARK